MVELACDAASREAGLRVYCRSMSARSSNETRHLFGGCDRLMSLYQTVGEALIAFENRISPRSVREGAFREAVAFVPLEVLESYHEDLLDPGVRDEKLFIKAARYRLGITAAAFCGLLAAVAIGVHAATTGTSLLVSAALTIGVALPFAVLWHYGPRGHVLRRMMFAQVVANEIARRRGRGKDIDGVTNFALARILGQTATGSSGAARRIFDA